MLWYDSHCKTNVAQNKYIVLLVTILLLMIWKECDLTKKKLINFKRKKLLNKIAS